MRARNEITFTKHNFNNLLNHSKIIIFNGKYFVKSLNVYSI